MSLIKKADDAKDIASLENIVVGNFSSDETLAIKSYSLETDQKLHDCLDMFLKTEIIQRSRKEEIARLLIQAGVKSGPEFNKVASYLLALHIKGYDHTPTWPNGKYMRSWQT